MLHKHCLALGVLLKYFRNLKHNVHRSYYLLCLFARMLVLLIEWCASRGRVSVLLKSNSCFLQLSFQMWTNQMQDTLNSKKKGDVAFRHKDFRAAIECYSQVRKFVKIDLSKTLSFGLQLNVTELQSLVSFGCFYFHFPVFRYTV